MATPISQEGIAIKETIGNEVSTIAVKFNQFSQLYLDGPETLALLSKSAALFFEFIGESLIRDIIMSIARLSDPAQTMGKDNLTFARLSNELTGDCKKEYDTELESLKNRMSAIKQWRNKHLAHNSLDHSLNKITLPNIDYDNLTECVKSSVTLLNIVNAHTGATYTMYDQVVQPGGASALITHLHSAFGRYSDMEKANAKM